MKEKLLRILNSDPATAGRPDDFLDSLAEDLQAVIIRAIAPGSTPDAVAALEHAVEDAYQSDFGISLFNLYSVSAFPGKKELYFSARKKLVKAALQTMLVEQKTLPDRHEAVVTTYSDEPTDGLTLKRRLKALTPKRTAATIN